MFGDELRAGATVGGRFRLVAPLGRGGMGTVWRARDAESEREVAVKILHPRLAANTNAVTRMAREAAALGRLDHENISRPIAFASGAHTYLAMELVEGQLLSDLVAEENGAQIPLPRVLEWFDAICRAVAHAHRQGIVHRDLKPQNVMIATDGKVKVLDFGIAKLLEQDASDGTTQGRTIGSLFYLSPEQTRGEPATPASDVFALGTLLFELLSSRRAWAHDRAGEPLVAFSVPLLADSVNAISRVVERINEGPRPRPTAFRAALPPTIDRVVARATAVDPARRYADADALLADVRDALVGERGELTMVRPVEPPREEEELTTRGRDPSLLDAPPTRAIEGGVSSFLDDSGTTRSFENVVAGPTQLVAPRAPPAALAPADELSIRGHLGRAPWYQSPRKLAAAASVGALALVSTTYLVTRATYERPPPPPSAAPTAPEDPPVAAIPAATPEPTTLPEPSPLEAPRASPPETPRPSPRRRPEPSRAPDAPPKPVAAKSALAGLLASARAAPEDAARQVALSKAILRAADKVSDPESRTNIRRLASSSVMVRDLEGLEDAYRELERALELVGEPLP